MKVYVRSDNNKNIITLTGDRQSFRIRQRNKLKDGSKTPSLKFISYKEMMKNINKTNGLIFSQEILLALIMVDNLCAIVITVLFLTKLSIADKINNLFLSFKLQTEISQKFVFKTFSVPKFLFKGKIFIK